MNVLAAIRRRQKRWTPRLSALLAVVWVGMLWQPCASATGVDGHAGHDGHAETALTAENAAHAAHASHAADAGQVEHAEHHCPHCPPLVHGDCETLTEECASLDRFDADRRTVKLNHGAGADDTPQVPIPYSSSLQPLLPAADTVRIEDYGSLPQGPPLNILYCTYLM